jgi:ribose transport system substrate-binding protein
MYIGIEGGSAMQNFARATATAVVGILCSLTAAAALDYPAPQPLAAGSQAPMPAAHVGKAPLRIAFLPPASTLNFYRPVGAGIRAVAKSAGAAVDELAPQDGTDTYAQAGMIQDAISRHVDAIIITTHDEHAAAPVLKSAVDKGIVVIVANSDIRSFPTPIHAVVGYSQRQAMRQLGQYVTGLAAGRLLNIGLIEGLPGYHNTERMEGFLSGIDRNKLHVVGRLSGSWTTEGGNTASLDILQAHPNINALIAANDDMAMGANLAAKSLGKRLLTTGADGQPPALEAVAAGEITATVDADPYQMGEIAMQVALDSLNGKFKGGWVETTTIIRDSSNAREAVRKTASLSPSSAKSR